MGFFNKLFLNKNLGLMGILSGLFILSACQNDVPSAPVATPKNLAQHSQEFRRELIKVRDGVYVAVGFGPANSILIEGKNSAFIVDTLINLEEAKQVAAEFKKVSQKPIEAIIYTHSHPDHINGTEAFIDPKNKTKIKIYAQGTKHFAQHHAGDVRNALTSRAVRMYGMPLSPAEKVNIGIGADIDVHDSSTFGMLPPNQLFDEKLETNIAGLRVELIHAPGETDDQLFVWLPELGVLCSGDNIYKAFPNLYTIRGTTYRDVKAWVESLDQMRARAPEYLLPSHGRPLIGKDIIANTLTDYRDGVRFVYEQTIRRINQGQTPDQIAAELKLPAHLAQNAYLQEFYGTPEWSARSIYAGQMGWFDGNPSRLRPLAPKIAAEKWLKLIGGMARAEAELAQAIAQKEYQWILELTDKILMINPENQTAKTARATALFALGAAESNPNARHWYLVAAHELRDGWEIPKELGKATPAMLRQMPLSTFLNGLAVNLRSEDTLDTNTKVVFRFTDSPEVWTLWVRHGVTELAPRALENPDIEVRVNAQVFKEMLARLRGGATTVLSEFEILKGSRLGFAGFMKYFQPE